MESNLKQDEKLLKAIFDVSNVGFCITNEDCNFEIVNNAYCRIYGYEREELIGKPFTLVVPPQNREYAFKLHQDFLNGQPEVDSEWKVVGKNGKVIDVFVTAARLIQEDGKKYKVTTVTDMSMKKKDEERIKYLATYNTVTNLPQRHVLESKLIRLIEKAEGLKEKFAIIMIDLDKFKYVNDSYGFNVGDKLLRAAGARIKRLMDGEGAISYFGEDHFAVLLEGVKCVDKAASIAENIRKNLSRLFFIDNTEINITSSIGISIFPDESKTGKELILHAEKAITEAKAKGGNCVKFYTDEMDKILSRRIQIELGLREAIKNHELFLVYQPQIDIGTGKMVGAEALLRWEHPALGLVPPDEFIAIAEDIGAIVPIGEWVIRTACKQIKLWEDKYKEKFKVAVNLSSVQLSQENFCELVKQIIIENNISPDMLEFELTESSMMKDIEKSILTFEYFKALGIKIAIDDFGTGYSSLSYLTKIPINKLKIDRSFIIDLGSDFDSNIITRTIIDMSKNLGFKVIAEGAETEEHINYLKENKCDEVQGYYFSKPLIVKDLENFINKLSSIKA